MSYNVVLGDLFKDAVANYIMHQVNAQGVMGAGVARQVHNDISNEDFMKYRNYVLRNGANSLGKVIPTQSISNPDRTYLNVVGQQYYGRNPNVQYTDMNALRTAFNTLANVLPEGTDIAMPYGMGAGLANGNWDEIESLAKEILGNKLNVTAYRLK